MISKLKELIRWETISCDGWPRHPYQQSTLVYSWTYATIFGEIDVSDPLKCKSYFHILLVEVSSPHSSPSQNNDKEKIQLVFYNVKWYMENKFLMVRV